MKRLELEKSSSRLLFVQKQNMVPLQFIEYGCATRKECWQYLGLLKLRSHAKGLAQSSIMSVVRYKKQIELFNLVLLFWDYITY